jgi:hypothetical protein
MRRIRWIQVVQLAVLSGILVFVGITPCFGQSNQMLDLSKDNLRDEVQFCGFITSQAIPFWGSIVGAKNADLNLSEGEEIYIKLTPGKKVKPGDRFTVVRISKSVTHPVTKKKIGQIVIKPGEITIIEAKESVVVAKINKCFHPILREDRIIPRGEEIPQSMPIRHMKKIEGIVLAPQEDIVTITGKEIVFIDRGSDDGVVVGAHFSIYQMGDIDKNIQKDKKVKLPLAKVGEAAAIAVQPRTSTVLITRSSQAIYVGDKVVSGKE